MYQIKRLLNNLYGKQNTIKDKLFLTLSKLGLYDSNFFIVEDLNAIMKKVTFDDKHLKLYKNIGKKK